MLLIQRENVKQKKLRECYKEFWEKSFFKVIRRTLQRRGHFSRALKEMRDTQRKNVTEEVTRAKAPGPKR